MPLDRFLLMLILILLFARIMAQLAERVKQPPVLGELIAGVLLGASILGWVPDNEILHLLAEVGVMLLLFEIGLETDLGALLRVGAKSLMVALIGIALPFARGIPDLHRPGHHWQDRYPFWGSVLRDQHRHYRTCVV